MAKQEQESSETQGVFLQCAAGLLPLGRLTVQNLGKDGELFWCRVLNSNVPISERLSGETEEKALAKGNAIIRDIADRVDKSPKSERLVIQL